MTYIEEYLPRISDFNCYGRLSYEAILQILETAGSHHSDTVGDFVIESSQGGIAWILAEWKVQILHHTDSKEKLQIATWVRGKAPTSAVYRDFIITDRNGSEVIRAEAKFALFDLNTQRLTRISEDLFASYKPDEKMVFEKAPRLRAPLKFTSEKELKLRRSDIDFNGHVHNTRYIVFALDALPEDVYAKDDFSEIQIVYSKPVNEQDQVITKYTRTEDGHFVGIYADDVLCALIVVKER